MVVKTEAKGNCCVSGTLIVLGALGIIMALFSMIYAASGLTLAFEGAGVQALQEACAATFNSNSGPHNGFVSYNKGECPGATYEPAPGNTGWVDLGSSIASGDADGAADALASLVTYGYDHYSMCGVDQKSLGCSYEFNKAALLEATEFCVGAAIAGAIFVIIASIPIMLNGVFGIKNKEVGAKVSGSVGVGLSIPSVLGAGICTIVLLVGVGLAHLAKAFLDTLKIGKEAALIIGGGWSSPCSDECEASLDATLDMGNHLVGYTSALTWLMVIMILLVLLESIFACVSCCFWKKKTTVAPAAAQPAVVQQPVVAQPAPVVKAEQ